MHAHERFRFLGEERPSAVTEADTRSFHDDDSRWNVRGLESAIGPDARDDEIGLSLPLLRFEVHGHARASLRAVPHRGHGLTLARGASAAQGENRKRERSIEHDECEIVRAR
jgi:hypothetical protein